MANDSSASVRSETPHLNTDIKRRAELLIHDTSLDSGTRNILHYGLLINDPDLADLVRRVDAGESIVDDEGFLQLER